MTAAVRTSSPDATRRRLLDAALGYASRGWHVFPLRPGTKRPATPDHPAHLCDRGDPRCHDGHAGWEQRATTDPDRITRAWTRHPFGIGIATGPSGLVVLDLDTAPPDESTGDEALAELEGRHRQSMPSTFTVATPSGGEHRYYRHPSGGPALANTASKVGPHIDTRANGGYVVAPPTQLTDAGNYRVLVDEQPPVLPPWFAALLTEPPPTPANARRSPRPPTRPPAYSAVAVDRYVSAAVEAETRRLTSAPPGTRNNTLFTAAVALGQLAGANVLDLDRATDALHDAAAAHVTAGAYSLRQAHSTIASGLRRGLDEPRQLPAHLTNDLEPAR